MIPKPASSRHLDRSRSRGRAFILEGKGMTVDLRHNKLDVAEHTITKLQVKGGNFEKLILKPILLLAFLGLLGLFWTSDPCSNSPNLWGFQVCR